MLGARRFYRTLLARVSNRLALIRSRDRGTASDDETLLRAEIFSAEQMEQHGRSLAADHVLGLAGNSEQLLRRLDENQQVLLNTWTLLVATLNDKLPIAPAAEWLLDNRHLIEEQIRSAKQHLPKGYSRELPRLARGPSRGLPRVYDLALESISHGDGRIDDEALRRFVASYQTITPLTLGELWAVPIMLRLALLENLRRVGVRITSARIQVNLAQDWANRMMSTAESDPKSLILVIADMARSDPHLASPFVAELTRRLQGHGPALALPLTWIEQRLAESSLTIEQMVQAENQQQASDQVSISNTIGSLRHLSLIDWRVFVEKMSLVEKVLLEDVDGVYGRMDFSSRDDYRHVVDRMAKRSRLSEVDIARLAITLALANTAGGHPRSHVGYYLVDAGMPQLEAAADVRRSVPGLVRRFIGSSPVILHIAGILGLCLMMSVAVLALSGQPWRGGWRLSVLALLTLMVMSQLASGFVNWLSTMLIVPRRLPRLDLSRGIPESLSTIVVVPTMLIGPDEIDGLIEALEVRFLGNQDEQLAFALLTDFQDAPHEELPQDAELLRKAREGIEALNQKYRAGEKDRFFLLHRPRRWNSVEGQWMGYERKRGKLADLNAALRSNGTVPFSMVVGRLEGLPLIKYVITLDTDTLLPRDAARQFVATMAHPLNRPRYDEAKQRVTGGYGILQPRLTASLSAANRSRYVQLFGTEPGIDPYTRSVSDVYQDAFGEGSFIGKGIYDVDAFEQSLNNRFPDDLILSHDLLEGCYARSGLLSDVCLFEDYPSQYRAEVKRQRRWIRGDWQIIHWLLPRVPGPDRKRLRNPLSALSRWKVGDNLRRSLVPAASMGLLIAGWSLGPRPMVWTLAVLAAFSVPSLLHCLITLIRKPDELTIGQHVAATLQAAQRSLAQSGTRIACLPYEAFYSLDAIARTCWRMLITQRRLLEWEISSNRDNNAIPGVLASFRSMWIGPVAALGTAWITRLRPEAVAAEWVFIAAWLASPGLVWWLSKPLLRRESRLDADQLLFLKKLSRKTWAFFEEFVVAADHWLPPDNFQEVPEPAIAHRTSPTNIGLSVLANLSALDFGFIAASEFIERTANTFDTMARLERHRGHFYNWYDTQTLAPLQPRYISSVDSGNLAGHLLTLKVGLAAQAEQKVIAPRLFEGLADTLAVLLEMLGKPAPDEVLASIERLKLLLDSTATVSSAESMGPTLQRLRQAEGDARFIAANLRGSGSPWAQRLSGQCHEALNDLLFLMPWMELRGTIDKTKPFADSGGVPTLRQLAGSGTGAPAEMGPPDGIDALVALGRERALARLARLEELALRAEGYASMEFGFLYDENRHVLAVGYNVDQFRRDDSYYDLLASEARLCTFVAIAQGQLPQESWFALGRKLTGTGSDPILVSWSGSMFEYLMPMLVMPTYVGSILEQTCRAAVTLQIAYGNQCSIPWGISESGYNAVDAGFNYQYHAFGVPGLGLKRGLGDDSVVAPYASALALMIDPQAACTNLQRLAAMGLAGRFGLHEAIDFSPSRVSPGQSSAIVRSFMSHHQGMTLLSLATVLLDRPMQRRFESSPLFQATLLLLQERVPRNAIGRRRTRGDFVDGASINNEEAYAPSPIGFDTPAPEVHLLSNGRYHVMVTNAGGGSSRWKDLSVTRWREDSTRDPWGSFFYLRDEKTGGLWSAGHQPTLQVAETYEAIFSEGRAEFRRLDHGIETYSEIVVSPEDDIELRRLRVTNRSRTRRTIEVTSYAEVVLAPAAADNTQPSFGNLFVQTEILTARRSILCTRRPRSIGEPSPSMFHLVAAHGADIGEVSFETDRMRFIGRGGSTSAPLAMAQSGKLSGTQGSVLDPIASIRCRLVLEPEEFTVIDFVTGASETRDACIAMLEKYQDRNLADRVFDLAWTHSGVTLRQINASAADAQLYRRLAGPVLYANGTLRAESGILMQNRRGQSGLWGYAISGDLPIVLLKIADSGQIELVRQMIQCHTYWRLKGLAVDLVIWNEDHVGYRQQLHDRIMGLIATGIESVVIDRPGGIFVRSAEQISSEDRILLQAVARVIIGDGRGTLSEQVGRRGIADKSVGRLVRTRGHFIESTTGPSPRPSSLLLGNEFGGFSADGSEYVIETARGQMTPAPWVNVIANPHFGTVVSESGLAYTWSENAHEFRLTPWSDDAVGSSSGEAFYLRDEESGHFWSPTPLPATDGLGYRTRHGFGYSVFEHRANGIRSELWIYVDLEESVKFSVLKIRNESGRTRRLSATGYVEWVLGDLRPKSAMHVVTEIDALSGAVFARNAYNTEFGGRVAFFDVDDPSRTLTGDRTEFLGRNGTLQKPEAMAHSRLSGKLGAGLDPCGAIQVPFELIDGQEREIIFRLGAGHSSKQISALVQRFRIGGAAREALAKVRAYWTRTLASLQVSTPDVSLNVLANGWLLYQTLACRLWARSGFYQSGGAFGFRDQLQDCMALVHSEPRLVREHLLRCAERQFLEGDVQHWWHPPVGRGVRTRCSDDYLWLPLAVIRYVTTTGDYPVLDENLHFLTGRPLAPEEESYYDLPGRSEDAASLYEHCVRAIQYGLRFGAHGLPLMGSGDWNDGMNLVGIQGRGESVWLAFFLYEILTSFSGVANRHGDASFAERCSSEALRLRKNIDEHAWDGAWYRRAYFDDGSPLGSSSNEECSIDSIAQSWSVLSEAGDDRRSAAAMHSLDLHLVHRDRGLVQLLTPPFDKSPLNPGYIKGYLPGVRENGGQYTHAAVWAAMAFAKLGDGPTAWEILAMINPVNHGRTGAEIAIYKTEPYVIAADVYGVEPHVGRGGWTWYTGSAGWLYRLITESLLGLKREGGTLMVQPCIPEDWKSFSMTYRFGETHYRIEIRQDLQRANLPNLVMKLDGIILDKPQISLKDDRVAHLVELDIRKPITAVGGSGGTRVRA